MLLECNLWILAEVVEIADIGLRSEVHDVEFVSLFGVVLQKESKVVGFKLVELEFRQGFFEVLIKFASEARFDVDLEEFADAVDEINGFQVPGLVGFDPVLQILGSQQSFEGDAHFCQVACNDQHLVGVLLLIHELLHRLFEAVQI